MPLRKTPTICRRFKHRIKRVRRSIIPYLDPWTRCASPDPTSRDSLSRNITTDQFRNVDYVSSAPWKSSADTAAIHPHRWQPVLCCPTSRLWLWRPARHPYRSHPPISCFYYQASSCSVSPLSKCYGPLTINHRNCITVHFL